MIGLPGRFCPRCGGQEFGPTLFESMRHASGARMSVEYHTCLRCGQEVIDSAVYEQALAAATAIDDQSKGRAE
jgi:ribosomal protein S27AE